MSIIKDFTFNGRTASSFGVQLADNTEWWATPERDMEHISVPGRSGDLLIDNGRFNNLEITFEVNRLTDGRALSNLINWLALNPGYQRLSVSDDPDHYRMASFESMTQPTFGQLKKSARISIPFNCKPQRYIVSDEEGVTITAGSPLTITNYGDTAKPRLELMALRGSTQVSASTLQIVDSAYPNETFSITGYNQYSVVTGYEGNFIDSESMQKGGIVNGEPAIGYQFIVTSGWSDIFGKQEPFLELQHGHEYTFTPGQNTVLYLRRWEL